MLARLCSKKKHQDHQAYFDSMATRIQRHWRGFFSRKYIHDFYKRKKFLAETQAKNAKIRKELEKACIESMAYQQGQVEELAQKHFYRTIKDKHHLVSTFAMPGIFNSPYDIVNGNVAMVDEIPLEDWLRMTGRAKAEKLPPLKRNTCKMRSRKSLQATPHFDTVRETLLLEEQVNNSMIDTQHTRLFSPSIRAREPYLLTQSIRNLEPYNDPLYPVTDERNDIFEEGTNLISSTPFKTSFPMSKGLFEDEWHQDL